MANTIRLVDYFYTTAEDKPGQSYQILEQLAGLGINLLAFTAVPIGPYKTQIGIFPAEAKNLTDLAQKTGLHLEGPHHAILVRGDDEIGALLDIHQKLYKAGVNVYASTAITSTKGTFGYLIYVRPEGLESAAKALDLG